MRLMDRVFSDGITPVSRQGWSATSLGVRHDNRVIAERQHTRTLLDTLRSIPLEIVSIDNVADYYFATSGKDPIQDWKSTDFPLIAPPFEHFWMEFQKPHLANLGLADARGAGIWFQGIDLSHLPDDEHFVTEPHPLVRDVTAKVTTAEMAYWEQDHGREFPTNDAWSKMVLERVAAWSTLTSVLTEDPDPMAHAAALSQMARTGVRWLLIASAVVETRTGVVGPVGVWMVPVMSNGSQAVGFYGPLSAATADSGLELVVDGQRVPSDDRIERLTGYILNPALLGLSFMHARGTQQRSRDPNQSEPKMARAYAKRHKRPMVRYKVLEIEAMRPRSTVGNEDGEPVVTGRRQSLHIRRGYWGDYREHGLFGRRTHRGVYWFEAAVRGTASAGVALHDYDVITPKFGEEGVRSDGDG